MKDDDKNISKKSVNENPVKPTRNNNNKNGMITGQTEKKTVNWAFRILIVVLLFVSGTVAGVYFMPALQERVPIIAQWAGSIGATAAIIDDMNKRVTDQQSQIRTLTQKITEQEFRLSQLSSSPSNEDTNALMTRMDTLEQSMSDAPSTTTSMPDSSQSTRIDMLLSRMSQLEASFIPLSKNMIDASKAEQERKALIEENLTFSDKLANLESRLIGMEKFAAKDNTGILLNLKIAELKRKVMSGEIYSNELNIVKELIENGSFQVNARVADALEYLSQKANDGILTPGQLERRFNELIPDILTAEDLAATSSWWSTALNNIKTAITIRKTDGTSYSTEGLDGLVTDIESWLKSSDLKSALDILASLPPAVQLLLDEWKIELETWLYSEDALNELELIAAEEYLTASTSEPIS